MGSEFSITQNDITPIVRASLSDANGFVDLSNSNVYFVYRGKYWSGRAPITGAADVISGANVEFSWRNSDVASPGVYYCQWKVSGAGAWSTFPNDLPLKYLISNVI